MKKSVFFGMIVLGGLVLAATGCATTKEVQFGEPGSDTVCLNLNSDIGKLYVTHVDGVATGAVRGSNEYARTLFGQDVSANPIYFKLTGNPVVLKITCPKDKTADEKGVNYGSCELILSKLSDLKGGDSLTLNYMIITKTFSLLDATGNILQQTMVTVK
jgi:hypothetical protein